MTEQGTQSDLVESNQKKKQKSHLSHDKGKEQFLQEFCQRASLLATMHNKALWILETTGSSDAADLKSALDTEYKLLFHDKKSYEKLLKWEKETEDRVKKREIEVLKKEFFKQQVPEELLKKISEKEACLAKLYASFRPEAFSKALSENAIRKALKEEKSEEKRKKIWEASKEIGVIQAPHILELVRLRNRMAKTLGFNDYFCLQLEMQEVDPQRLDFLLDDLAKKSEKAYEKTFSEIEEKLKRSFGGKTVYPWHWSDPFGQEDPLEQKSLGNLVEDLDFLQAAKHFYSLFGFDVEAILQRSDHFEKKGKSQHAFCINIDREKDIRVLNNIQPSIKWLETLLHELGHAVYEEGFDPDLPWALKEPPHMITTEAIALLMGRFAYRKDSLKILSKKKIDKEGIEEGLKRRQLIFSRWVLVMHFFEKALYENPDRDLNALWWDLVQKYQKISPPEGRKAKADWAAKYHIGLAPVYYYSYLLGELFASLIEETVGKKGFDLISDETGGFLKEKIFFPGNSLPFEKLIERATGKALEVDAWVKQFAT